MIMAVIQGQLKGPGSFKVLYVSHAIYLNIILEHCDTKLDEKAQTKDIVDKNLEGTCTGYAPPPPPPGSTTALVDVFLMLLTAASV